MRFSIAESPCATKAKESRWKRERLYFKLYMPPVIRSCLVGRLQNANQKWVAVEFAVVGFDGSKYRQDNAGDG